jgi:hypothetical protein
MSTINPKSDLAKMTHDILMLHPCRTLHNCTVVEVGLAYVCWIALPRSRGRADPEAGADGHTALEVG